MMTEDEMVGWHYQLKGHEFEQGPGLEKDKHVILGPASSFPRARAEQG